MYKNSLKLLLFASITGTFSLISCSSGSDKTESSANEDTVEATDQAINEVKLDFSAGEAIYKGKGMCQTCHMETGLGLPPNFPPLANADYLLADKNRAVSQALYGSKEPIQVNGVTYPGGIMSETIKNVVLTNQEVADVVNYILNSWGNNGGTVSISDVEAARNLHVE